ncbi:PIN domain protein [Methanobrevibacter filiformis]|uniref:PIN domain protein n=1 Tax=Methanobrevibacter filiformis TaxID=55758 RepID=A0A166CUN4_9EURY|nr:PIN domain-containing protein [Methanobrevibacter filiformis]KZX16957.1 PIN domain protein [Methanobrevibacter filiformis]
MKKETDHVRAVEIAKTIQNEEKIISKLVVAETITVLRKKIPTKDIAIIYNILQKFITIEDSYIFDNAFKEFVKYNGKISFFDAVYIALMKDLEIYEIASFDSDFDNKKRIVRIH